MIVYSISSFEKSPYTLLQYVFLKKFFIALRFLLMELVTPHWSETVLCKYHEVFQVREVLDQSSNNQKSSILIFHSQSEVQLVILPE